jgi:site-specific recombinase XerD
MRSVRPLQSGAEEDRMIEKFFEHPYTLRYLRGGATGGCVDAFASMLVKSGYARQTGRHLLRGVAHLGHWLAVRRIPLASLDEAALDAFFVHVRRCRCVRRHKGLMGYCGWGARRFLPWARERGLVETPPPVEELPPLIVEFEAWMIHHRNVAPVSLHHCYRRHLRRFLEAVGDDPGRFDAAGIRRFILAQAQRTGRSCAKLAVTAVRMLLRFLVVSGRCGPELVDAVPTLAHWKLAALPSYIARDSVEKIVESCDRSSDAGRRDRAMLLLMARLGLRACEVAGLRLGDIDWEAATVTVRGKSRRATRMPLPQDVGDAMIASLAGGPRAGDDDHVFRRLKAPRRALSPSAVGLVAVRAAERAGVSTPRAGSHVLRHSVATALLGEGVSLPAIGALLRHRSLQSTAVYAKVDVGLLDTVVQPWPEEVSA